jgi:hypothetical protein
MRVSGICGILSQVAIILQVPWPPASIRARDQRAETTAPRGRAF